ncbi:type II toxin-antitoxin system VapC family toxin [Geoalkalibacter halelectricus]|uniref:type II toxin-antitoxin system VapC family toxin n=1 Tax=Geoalkalibacter halelectricus TaxID=2847045 RepID=UPI003D1B4167
MRDLAIFNGQKIYLDTNIFIYALEGYADYSGLLDVLFNLIESGQTAAVSSELALGEALVKPMMDGNEKLVSIYQATIQDGPLLNVVPVHRDILVWAAPLRAQYTSLRLPDAIHAATAISAGCGYFLTNDRRLQALQSPKIVLLADLR